jgi:hypothetical protein
VTVVLDLKLLDQRVYQVQVALAELVVPVKRVPVMGQADRLAVVLVVQLVKQQQPTPGAVAAALLKVQAQAAQAALAW